MIHPYEWADYRLIVMARTRSLTITFLLSGVSQRDFFEHWLGMWDSERDVRIVELSVSPITEEVFDMLTSVYEAEYVLEG